MVVQVALAPETATVRAGDDAHVGRRHLQRIGERAMNIVRDLGGGPQRELALAVHRGNRGVLLDRQVGVALVEENVVEHVIGFRERFPDVAKLIGLKAMDVAPLSVALDTRFLGRERFLGIGDRLQRPVFDLDQVERFESGLLVAGDYRRDRVADVANALRRERILILGHRKNAEGDGKILAGQHEMHAGAALSAGDVDRFDDRVRQRRAQQFAMHHARQHHVVGKAR